MCENTVTCIQKLHDNSKLAVAVSQIVAQTTAGYAEERIFCLDKNTHDVIEKRPISVLMRRDFKQRCLIDRGIDSLMTSGLISKWYRDTRGQIRINFIPYDYINFGHLIFTFYFIIFPSFFITMFCFSAELFSQSRFKREKRFKKICKLIEMMCDGKRYFYTRSLAALRLNES